jgi:hypothetical protein
LSDWEFNPFFKISLYEKVSGLDADLDVSRLAIDISEPISSMGYVVLGLLDVIVYVNFMGLHVLEPFALDSKPLDPKRADLKEGYLLVDTTTDIFKQSEF